MMILSLFLIVILIGTIKINSPHELDAYLEDSYSRQYPLFFNTTFGAGKQVTYCLHTANRALEDAFQDTYSGTFFEIHRREGSFQVWKRDPDIQISISRNESVVVLDDEPEELTEGSELSVSLKSDICFHFSLVLREVF